MFKFIVIVALIVPLVLGVNFQQCSQGQPTPADVEVIGCEVSPCDFNRGESAHLYMTFFSPKAGLDGLTATVVAILFGFEIPYALPTAQADVCNRLVLGSCPLDFEEPAIYHIEMPILDEYPAGITAPFEFTVRENNTIIACFGFAASIH